MKNRIYIVVFVLFVFSFFGIAEETREWPKEIKTDRLTVLMYQPQLDRLDGDKLYARAAVSVARSKEDLPIFGAIWLEARIETDPTTRMVSFHDIKIPKVYFAEATEEQKKRFADGLKKEIPTWSWSLSKDRLIAMLKGVEKKNTRVKKFNDTAPKIMIVERPTVLVTLEGDAKFAQVEGSPGIEKVLNTPFLILRKDRKLYLSATPDVWYVSDSILGPWSILGTVPSDIKALASSVQKSSKKEGVTTAPPAILVATEPTELIVLEGKPQLKPLEGNKLMVVSNSDAPLFLEIATQHYFVLLSGRWFSSKSLKGSWKFVAPDQLPKSFASIPSTGDESEVRAWIAGTKEAEEAVLEASIPQTAAIRRDATITVKYDGKPQFKSIGGTSLKYAVNTDAQVLQSGNRFFCAKDGAWYVANAAEGPWITATEIPAEIQNIPASNPLFNVSYLYIFGFNDEVVFFGYYPGYTNSYIYHDTVVYGTGYYYDPWCYHHCYFRPCTWGFLMRWHIWHGWGSGCRYLNTRYRFGLLARQPRSRGLWGPAGYQRALVGKNIKSSQLAKIQARRNLYQRGSNAKRIVKTRNPRVQKQAKVAAMKRNNLYVDKNKRVVRRAKDGSWEHRKNGKWEKQPVQQPKKRPTQMPKKRPVQVPKKTVPKKQPRNSNLEREAQKRQRGRELQNHYRQRRSAPARRGGFRR